MATSFARRQWEPPPPPPPPPRHPYTRRPFSLTARRRTNRTRDDARAYLEAHGPAIAALVRDLDAAIAAADAAGLRPDGDALRGLKRDYAAHAAALRGELDPATHDQAASSQYLAVLVDVLNRVHARVRRRPRRDRARRDFWTYGPAHMRERSRRERAADRRLRAVYADALADAARLDRAEDEARALRARNEALEAEVRRLRAGGGGGGGEGR